MLMMLHNNSVVWQGVPGIKILVNTMKNNDFYVI